MLQGLRPRYILGTEALPWQFGGDAIKDFFGSNTYPLLLRIAIINWLWLLTRSRFILTMTCISVTSVSLALSTIHGIWCCFKLFDEQHSKSERDDSFDSWVFDSWFSKLNLLSVCLF